MISLALNTDERPSFRKMIREKKCLRLLPHHPIYVDAWCGHGARFVRLFRDVWNRLPLAVRRRIISFWRGPSWKTPHLARVELALCHGTAIGHVGLWGTEFRIDVDMMAIMPDAAVHWVIAHELAHVIQWQNGSMNEMRRLGLVEEDADEYVELWEIDRQPLEEWEQQQRRAAA